ncbi:hypothetical protein JO972_13785 [Verrucomicrobiaceae bacterium 5K15]|uniref:Uncharacterized protein n=1 Tax=Oceaniferula flava TaxID=2800421 RepID=A0AAE2SFI0_9BACT|nr:hypothetical protein [Oceaniferula flavus]MBK1856037.1 hypothetical protein [Oceaniferula flavus]MBM1137344.1 hypothetical protein [Oceaniferula flavus]
MLLRFHTYEEACLFAAMKRAEGYFAEVIHENFGHVYGQLASNGVAVILSEEAAPEGVTVPVSERRDSLLGELGKVAGMFAILGMLGGLLWLASAVVMTAAEFSKLPDRVLLMGLASLVVLFLLLWGSLMLTRIYHRPGHPLYGLSRLVIKSILWVMVLSYVMEFLVFIAWLLVRFMQRA